MTDRETIDRAIRRGLGLPNDHQLTDEDRQRVTTLSLSSNQLTDVAPLAGLTSLTTLSLSGNQLTDVAPLAGLTSLTTLSLADNQLTDVAPLCAALPNCMIYKRSRR